MAWTTPNTAFADGNILHGSDVDAINNNILALAAGIGKSLGAVDGTTPSGLTVARLVGQVASGAPSTGTWSVGDVSVDATGKLWVCTAAGTPGTWLQVGGGALTTPTTATVATSQATTSATFTDLTTAGPAVTVTIGSNKLALVTLTGQLTGAASNAAYMGFAISGANTAAASTAQVISSSGANVYQMSASYLVSLSATGSTTFTAKYESGAGGTSVSFANRSITVQPF